jgi:hypothetical protein
MSEKYCWMFGEHKGIPCPCGYPNKQDMELIITRKQLEVAIEALKKIYDDDLEQADRSIWYAEKALAEIAKMESEK